MDTLAEAFRHAFRRHPAGVAILTAEGESGPVALTISSLISLSAAPPLVAFSLSNASRSAAAFLQAASLIVHLPGRADEGLAALCATSGSLRFGPDSPWQRLATGEPRYTQVATWFRARIRDRMPVEGATLVTAELLEGEADHGREAVLVYLNRSWHGLGQSPAAPACCAAPVPVADGLTPLQRCFGPSADRYGR